MKVGTENRKKTIAAAALGTFALLYLGYMLYGMLGGSSSTPAPAPTVAPVTRTLNSTNAALSEPANTPSATGNSATGRAAVMPSGNAAGVAAKKIAVTSASLDPTLDQSAMLRTEHLVYAGTGRNIFSATNTKTEVIPIPTNTGRKNTIPTPPVYVPPPPPPTCPPSCPPINLKFFGTLTTANGTRKAYLLQGEDVFLALQGDIVARKYKIASISANSIQVEDLTNNNTQTLPLQSN